MIPVGSPAIGDDFFDREAEISQIASIVKTDHVLLIAPRRFGKTSIMRGLEKELLNRGHQSIFLEVEDVYSPQRFLSEIIIALIENEGIRRKTKLIHALKEKGRWIKDGIRENIKEIGIYKFKVKLRSSVEEDLKKDWEKRSNEIFDVIRNEQSYLHIIVDEFPVAIKNMTKVSKDETEKFMHWFRRLRQTTQNLRFIAGGSVSIDRVVRDVGGVASINDFKRFRVGGFQKEAALGVIKKVFIDEGWHYESSLGEKILNCIGEAYIPYFIAVMLSAIKEEKILRGSIISDDLIETVYNFHLLGNEGKHYFEHYYQRLKIFYTPLEEKAAKAILRKICSEDYFPVDLAFGIFVHETGQDDYEKFMDLVADLCNDFYLEHDFKKGVKFYSKMLRDWWRIYYGDIE
jgi:AAA+ ATPase superfamily predicted ATPase